MSSRWKLSRKSFQRLTAVSAIRKCITEFRTTSDFLQALKDKPTHDTVLIDRKPRISEVFKPVYNITTLIIVRVIIVCEILPSIFRCLTASAYPQRIQRYAHAGVSISSTRLFLRGSARRDCSIEIELRFAVTTFCYWTHWMDDDDIGI